MTTDSGKKPLEIKEMGKNADGGYCASCMLANDPCPIHNKAESPCENCNKVHKSNNLTYFTCQAQVEDILYHTSRELEEAKTEITRLKKQLKMCKEALKYYRGSDDDETSWMEPDQYVPYWTLWHDGNNVGGKVADDFLKKVGSE